MSIGSTLSAYEKGRTANDLETILTRYLRVHVSAASLLAVPCAVALAQQPSDPAVPVTIDNHIRALSDVYLGQTVKAGAFGKFRHGRELAPVARRGIVRPNRDTPYSFAVFDFDAGAVTVTLPGQSFHGDAGRQRGSVHPGGLR
jgi:hypothetical protein